VHYRDVSSSTRKELERPGKEGGKRAENRKHRILALKSAGLRLFLELGIEAVTIDQIVDAAQTAKGSFYRYFKDKTDLVQAIITPALDDVRAAFDRCADGLRKETSADKLTMVYQVLGEDLFRVVLSHPDEVRLYLHESRGPASGARLPVVKMAVEVLERAAQLSAIAREQGFVRPMPGRLAAVVVVGAAELLLSRIFAGDEVSPILEMPQNLVSLVLDGVRVRTTAENGTKKIKTAASAARRRE
jgi:AcrR family transcriptional regulator